MSARTDRKFQPMAAREFHFQQSENSELRYTGNWVPVADGNNITASSWEVVGGSLTLSSEALVSNVTSVVVSGGTGLSRLVNKVTFTDGQVDERILNIRITENTRSYLNDDYGMGCGYAY